MTILAVRKPLAVVIKGNPDYIKLPAIQPLANKFYLAIKDLLVNKGFRVKFNDGAEYTTPNPKAVAWIAHSRGIDRLRFAPKTIQTIALRTKDKGADGYKTKSEQAHDPLHYELADSDIAAINALHL